MDAWTDQNTKDLTAFYSRMSLSDIRKWQRITEDQLKRAHEIKNTEALKNLRKMEDILASVLLGRG